VSMPLLLCDAGALLNLLSWGLVAPFGGDCAGAELEWEPVGGDTEPVGEVEGPLAGSEGVTDVEVALFRVSSGRGALVPCFAYDDGSALSVSGERSEEAPKSDLFRSTNLNAGSFDGLWSRRCACKVIAFGGECESSKSMMESVSGPNRRVPRRLAFDEGKASSTWSCRKACQCHQRQSAI